MQYTVEQAEELANWALRIKEQMENIDPELQLYINDHFWEMLDEPLERKTERLSRIKQEAEISDMMETNLYKTI